MADTEYYKKITENIFKKYEKDTGNKNYFYLFKIIYKIYLKKEYDNDDNDVIKIHNSILNDGEEVIEDNVDEDKEGN
jgi:hypothetical protein